MLAEAVDFNVALMLRRRLGCPPSLPLPRGRQLRVAACTGLNVGELRRRVSALASCVYATARHRGDMMNTDDYGTSPLFEVILYTPDGTRLQNDDALLEQVGVVPLPPLIVQPRLLFTVRRLNPSQLGRSSTEDGDGGGSEDHLESGAKSGTLDDVPEAFEIVEEEPVNLDKAKKHAERLIEELFSIAQESIYAATLTGGDIVAAANKIQNKQAAGSAFISAISTFIARSDRNDARKKREKTLQNASEGGGNTSAEDTIVDDEIDRAVTEVREKWFKTVAIFDTTYKNIIGHFNRKYPHYTVDVRDIIAAPLTATSPAIAPVGGPHQSTHPQLDYDTMDAGTTKSTDRSNGSGEGGGGGESHFADDSSTKDEQNGSGKPFSFPKERRLSLVNIYKKHKADVTRKKNLAAIYDLLNGTSLILRQYAKARTVAIYDKNEVMGFVGKPPLDQNIDWSESDDQIDHTDRIIKYESRGGGTAFKTVGDQPAGINSQRSQSRRQSSTPPRSRLSSSSSAGYFKLRNNSNSTVGQPKSARHSESFDDEEYLNQLIEERLLQRERERPNFDVR